LGIVSPVTIVKLELGIIIENRFCISHIEDPSKLHENQRSDEDEVNSDGG
jgi:hypothetical protein